MARTIRAKVAVIGDPAVGKTALCQMFHSAGQRFPKHYLMTLGVEFCVKAIPLPNNVNVELHLFDLAGQEIYAEMCPAYWEGAAAVVLVYDVTRQHTLDACGNWYGRILETLGQNSLPGVLIANKCDLRERTIVPRAAGQALAQQMGMEFFEASAVEGQAVDAPFHALAAKMAEKYDESVDALQSL